MFLLAIVTAAEEENNAKLLGKKGAGESGEKEKGSIQMHF